MIKATETDIDVFLELVLENCPAAERVRMGEESRGTSDLRAIIAAVLEQVRLATEAFTDVRGVYSLDDTAVELLIHGQDQTGEHYLDVPVRLVSNPVDGLPEKLSLRFREKPEEAKLLADRPNAPIQITVEYRIER